MANKEAKARIKINKLLEEAGWQFIGDETNKANVVLESGVSLTHEYMADKWGDDFEKTKKGYIDYLLLDSFGYPLALLEAKRESIHPLNAKEQARKYARAQKVRYIYLSNGNITYQWDLQKGNPQVVSKFPTPQSLGALIEWNPDRNKLINEVIDDGYIAISQIPNYKQLPEYQEMKTRAEFIDKNALRFLRPYQIEAVQSIQYAVKKDKERFLFEMATGTGKTLTAAAIIKLFIRTGNANRVLFLVDRLELEDQAKKNFVNYLKNDYKTVIFKENKDNWHLAEIVVSTVQSLLANDKYKDLFATTDFDLLISDEAHRSIGGNSRAVFEYFHGYKLGLTATPRDYLKGIDTESEKITNPREMEVRLMKDTYTTFGCHDGRPTFRYSLKRGVDEDYLVAPTAIDARTNITTQLLSDDGYAVMTADEDREEEEQTFIHKDFERRFFSQETNRAFCSCFMESALVDPISNEIGKTLIFCVSQNHARKITAILNEIAEEKYPGRYNSDFAVQVTSLVSDAQQMTINFTNNRLNGYTRWLDGYRSSKTRVCVTVGMMTTGYDCTDILNLCLMRPIFSPTDFIQMKGRGTRKHSFKYSQKDSMGNEEIIQVEKKTFKLFDFFANCEYFEENYDYDQKIKVIMPAGDGGGGNGQTEVKKNFVSDQADSITEYNYLKFDAGIMRIDEEMFRDRFETRIKGDSFIKTQMEAGNWAQIISYIKNEIFERPEEYFNLEKLSKTYKLDRKLTIREIIEKIFGIIPGFKIKDELLEEEFQKFVTTNPIKENENITALRQFFKAYIVDRDLRQIIHNKEFALINNLSSISMADFKAISKEGRSMISKYIETYVALDKFAA